MKNNESFEVFRSSLLRCLSNLHFLESFYDTFMASSPEVREAFAHTDMERQKAMLNASLYQLMNLYGSDDAQARNHIEELGAAHGAYGHRIPLHLYDMWLESLMDAVKASDPNFSPEIDAVWREVMSMGIDIMKASSHRYPKTTDQNPLSDETEVVRSSDLQHIIDQLKALGKDAANRSNTEKDTEATAFQFGQYRAYLHAGELLGDLIKKAAQTTSTKS